MHIDLMYVWEAWGYTLARSCGFLFAGIAVVFWLKRRRRSPHA